MHFVMMQLLLAVSMSTIQPAGLGGKAQQRGSWNHAAAA